MTDEDAEIEFREGLAEWLKRIIDKPKRVKPSPNAPEGGVKVYIMEETPGGFLKVGTARDVSARRRELQVGNPRPLRVYFTLKFEDRRAAEAVEVGAHKLLHNCRQKGEWFACNLDTAKAAIIRAASNVTTPKVLVK
jgi:hypothetical protein